jgi:hypothetical protein
MLTVVLPQPPFWLKTVMILAGTATSLSALKAQLILKAQL